VRLVERESHREAVTSRPAIPHAGQNRLSVNLSHARSAEIKEKLACASHFLRGLLTTAEQLSQPERWRRILEKIFERYLEGRPLTGPRQQRKAPRYRSTAVFRLNSGQQRGAPWPR
jgi:hypothetical protein